MKIVQVVRYVTITGAPGPGTVALDDSGKIYLLREAPPDYSLAWQEMPVPALPSTTLTLKPKAK